MLFAPLIFLWCLSIDISLVLSFYASQHEMDILDQIFVQVWERECKVEGQVKVGPQNGLLDETTFSLQKFFIFQLPTPR